MITIDGMFLLFSARIVAKLDMIASAETENRRPRSKND